MALTRISPGVYRNAQGKIVYSKDGKMPSNQPKKADPKKKASNPVGNSQGPRLENVSGAAIAQDTQNLAGQQLGQAAQPVDQGGAGLGTAYVNPEDTTNRIGVDSATTSRLAEEAFARVNQDITRRELDERSQLQAELANRGININNPEDPTYKRFMQDQERKFANERTQQQSAAQAQATQTQIGLAGIGLQERQQQVGESAGARNQNLAEIESLINLGLLARKPNYTQQELDIARQNASRRNSGGGGAQAPNVFNSGLPPSAPR
jgi:hypothetical protein